MSDKPQDVQKIYDSIDLLPENLPVFFSGFILGIYNSLLNKSPELSDRTFVFKIREFFKSISQIISELGPIQEFDEQDRREIAILNSYKPLYGDFMSFFFLKDTGDQIEENFKNIFKNSIDLKSEEIEALKSIIRSFSEFFVYLKEIVDKRYNPDNLLFQIKQISEKISDKIDESLSESKNVTLERVNDTIILPYIKKIAQSLVPFLKFIAGWIFSNISSNKYLESNPKTFFPIGKSILQPLVTSLSDKPILKDLKKMIEMAVEKDKTAVINLIQNYIQIIWNFPEMKNISATSNTLTNWKISTLRFNFNEKIEDPKLLGIKIGKIIADITDFTLNFEKQRGILLKNVDQMGVEVDGMLDFIASEYERSRYFFGLLLGFFDIIQEQPEKSLKSYFSVQHNTFIGLYIGKRMLWNEKKKRLFPSRKKKKNLKKYFQMHKSFPNLNRYVKNIILYGKPLRIHNSHHKRERKQDLLDKGIYWIFDTKKGFVQYKVSDISKTQNYLNYYSQRNKFYISFLFYCEFYGGIQ